MMDYDWPGNVRELENALQYGLIKCRGNVLQLEHLPPRLREQRTVTRRPAERRRKRKLDAEEVRRALQETNGNKVQAARKLGVARATLYRFLNQEAMLTEAQE